ncbi:MAG: translation initiation factor IF-3 [Eubacteriaceae bacterium]|nr:translation initiation factor IF-3 [Eubacteriaceae bacterium]
MARRCFIKEFQINGQIRDKELRVIDENGQMIGVLTLQEAVRLAESKELDLVKVSPEAKPPVCKILDYGKFRYEQNRRKKDSKKNQKIVTIKEVRTSVRVQDHDLMIKVKNVQKFISEGDKVKVSVRFRGREMAYIEKGRDLLMRIKDMIGEECIIEKPPKVEGRNYVMYLAPKKTQ